MTRKKARTKLQRILFRACRRAGVKHNRAEVAAWARFCVAHSGQPVPIVPWVWEPLWTDGARFEPFACEVRAKLCRVVLDRYENFATLDLRWELFDAE